MIVLSHWWHCIPIW